MKTKDEVKAAVTATLIAPIGEASPLMEQSVQAQYLDEYGREKPNPVPLEPPIGYVKRPTIAETMRQLIKQASFEARMQGAETEDEANDFDVDEDYDPETPYEHDFEPDPVLDQMIALQSRPPEAAVPAAPAPTPSPPAAASVPQQ